MKSSKIYAELAQALKIDCKDITLVTPNDKEVLVEAIAGADNAQGGSAGVSDEIWYGLSEAARVWVEDGIKAIAAKIEIAHFPDAVEESSARPARVRTSTAPVEEKPIEVAIAPKKPSLDAEDIKEGLVYKITFDKGDVEAGYQWTVAEVTRRSIIFEDEGKSSMAIPKKDIIDVFIVEDEVLPDKENEVLPDQGEGAQKEECTLLVRDAVKDQSYSISVEGDGVVAVVCVMVTSHRGIFDETDGTRHRLGLDVEIQGDGPVATTSTEASVTTKPEVQTSSKVDKKVTTAKQFIREALCTNPGTTVEDVKKGLVESGLKFSDNSLSSLFKDTEAVLNTLKSMDKLK